MKFVNSNAITENGQRVRIKVNPRLVEEIWPTTYIDHAGATQEGARLTYQTGRVVVIAESVDAIAGALSRGFDQ